MFPSRYSARMIVTSLAVTSAMAAHAGLAVAEDLDANTQLADVIADEQENLTNENQNMNQQDASGNGVMSEQQERIIALLDETLRLPMKQSLLPRQKTLAMKVMMRQRSNNKQLILKRLLRRLVIRMSLGHWNFELGC